MKRFACFFVLCACLAACDKPPSLPPYELPIPANMQEANDFATTLTAIGQEVKELGVPDELFTSKSFNKIYTSPQNYLAATMAVMTRKNIGAHEKLIAGYAMQRLPPEQFVAFTSALADNVEHGQTEVDVLETVAFAPLNFGHQSLIMYYQNPTVRTLLERLLHMPSLSTSHQEYIKEDLLTGKAKTDYLDYLAMIGRSALNKNG